VDALNALRLPHYILSSILPVACLFPQPVLAHGAWLGNGSFDFTPATVTLLSNNVSNGTGGFQDGDFIELTASFPVLVNGTLSGPGGYITFYVPPGTEVAGTWIVNAAGATISARTATSAVSGEGTDGGWGPQGQGAFTTGINGWNPGLLPTGCSDTLLGIAYTASNCTTALSHLYGDTGIFYSTRADTAMFANGAQTILLTNGYQTNPTNAAPWGSVGGGGNERVHNKWDAVQTNAFGAASVIANGFSTADETIVTGSGRGSTPFNAGSPVAGPDSGVRWDRYAASGPWNRISYAGACFAGSIGNKAANGVGSTLPTSPAINAVNSISSCSPTFSGVVLNDSTRLPPQTNALRFALGGITSGETHYVKVRLKVTNAALLDAANFEGHGGDSTQGAKASNDNPWRYWIGAVATAPLATVRLPIKKSIVSVNGVAYRGTDIPPGAAVRYRITYANGFAQSQSNVVISDVLPPQATGVSNYAIISGPNILPANLSAGVISFAPIASLPPGRGGVVEFTLATNSVAGQILSNTGRVNSTQLVTQQTSVVSIPVTIPPPLSLTKVSAVYDDPVNGMTFPKAIPGALVTYTIAINNPGGLTPDANTIIIGDATPAGLTVHVADIGAPGSGPITFIDGTTGSSLGYTFSGLASAVDDVEFSNDGGVTWVYAPVPNANGDDTQITNVRIKPQGAMASASSFAINIRYRIN
jgi:large repetitive protein